MFMEKILISACLIGDKTRYDGKSNYHPLVKQLLEKYELVPFCPEIEGGLSTPRQPSEIQKDKVVNSYGKDVTKYFKDGASKALMLCQYLRIKTAILKENSPSCGLNAVYDGTFTGHKIKGSGITAQLLIKNGITVISENDIENFLTNN